jgi:hypothetical protein
MQIVEQLKTLWCDIAQEGFYVVKIGALYRLFGKYAVIELLKYRTGFLVAFFTALDSNFKVSHCFTPHSAKLRLCY